MNNKHKKIFIEFIKSLFSSLFMVPIATGFMIIILFACSFFGGITVRFPFDTLAIVNESVGDKIGVTISYSNSIFIIMISLSVILAILISIMKNYRISLVRK